MMFLQRQPLASLHNNALDLMAVAIGDRLVRIPKGDAPSGDFGSLRAPPSSAFSFTRDKNHGKLIGAITAQGAAVDAVLPYAYDAQAADANIVTAIEEMAQGRIDAIALTSSGQVRRLIDVASAHGCEARLREGLARTRIASVGPVVSDELKSHGLRTDIAPANEAYFMKPLISAMAAALGKTPPRSAPPR